MTKRAVIILAGGQARRFQLNSDKWEDKALAVLFGKPLIVNIIEKISDLVNQIVICVNDEARKAQFSKVLRQYSIENVKICIDEKNPGVGGPLVAIATGLKFTNAHYCLTLPCDVPLIQPKVVNYLFEVSRGSHVTVPVWPDGVIESLMMICERPKIAQIADALCELRRRRPDDLIRGASEVLFVSTVSDLSKLDPEFRSFININLREDLVRLKTRVSKEGPIKESLHIKIGALSISEIEKVRTATRFSNQGKLLEAIQIFSLCSTRFEAEKLNFWAGISNENQGKTILNLSEKQETAELKKKYCEKGKMAFVRASQNYELEAAIYDKIKIRFLARHARVDQSWCQQRTRYSSLKREKFS